MFAPANLRAAAENPAYRDYVSELIALKYTLRYSGGFVPDVHHILSKVRIAMMPTCSLIAACMRACLADLLQDKIACRVAACS